MDESLINYKPVLSAEEEIPAEEYNPYWSGVTHEREWRDIVFFVLFWAVLAVTVTISLFSYYHGDPTLFAIVGKSWDWVGFSAAQLYEWRFLLPAALGGSILLALLWLLLLMHFARIIIIGSVLLAVCSGIAVSILLVVHGRTYGLVYLQGSGGLGLVGSLALAALLAWQRRRILLVTAVIKEASLGLAYNKMIALVALLISCVISGLAVLWAISIPFLLTVSFNGLDFSIPTRYLALFSLFGFLLTVRTAVATLETTVAGATAAWYFAHSAHGRREPGSPTLNALARAVGKSFGSIAFGALIVALCDFVNLLLRLLDRDVQNRPLRCLLGTARRCIGLLRAFVQFVNRMSFVYVAMYGDSFCRSGRRVVALLGRVGFDAVVVDRTVSLTVSVARTFGVVLVVGGTALTFTLRGVAVSPGPLVAAGVCALAVWHTFSVVVIAATNTVFVCYAEDLERNRESGQYFATAQLHSRMQLLKGAL